VAWFPYSIDTAPRTVAPAPAWERGLRSEGIAEQNAQPLPAEQTERVGLMSQTMNRNAVRHCSATRTGGEFCEFDATSGLWESSKVSRESAELSTQAGFLGVFGCL